MLTTYKKDIAKIIVLLFGLFWATEILADNNTLSKNNPDEQLKIEKRKNQEIAFDKKNKIVWQKTYSKKKMHKEDAVKYCSSLKYGGVEKWRMPTISEMKTLIKGCASVNAAKYRCKEIGGPGEHGCYWDDKIMGKDCDRFWSITPEPGGPDYGSFFIDFYNGGIATASNWNEYLVICVADL